MVTGCIGIKQFKSLFRPPRLQTANLVDQPIV